jgi:DNA-binding response OmpR family regulator
MRKFIKSELSDKFRIIEANDGNEGLEKTINEIPDMVISDIMMGENSGIDLCRSIKTDIRTSHIPVILLTALSEDNYKIEGLETGADDYLVKPFNTEILKARIFNLIALRKQLQEKFSNSVGLNNRAAAVNSSDQKFMDKLFAIISQEMENPDIDVNLFTREIGMSKTQLYKKVKALTGQSLFEFIYTIRLKKAAEILVNENVSVSEAAARVGYSNLSVFTRSFTRQFKINPSKYASIYNPKKLNS